MGRIMRREDEGGYPLPPVSATCRGALLVIGGARCVWEDLAAADTLTGRGNFKLMAVNDSAMFIPEPITHMASLHPKHLGPWRALRKARYPTAGHSHTHSVRKADGVDFVWSPLHSDGLSGLFGVQVGLMLGYERIVLAGIPMDDSGTFWEPPEVRRKYGLESYERAWKYARDNYFRGRVKSLSGNTRDWLGGPS